MQKQPFRASGVQEEPTLLIQCRAFMLALAASVILNGCGGLQTFERVVSVSQEQVCLQEGSRPVECLDRSLAADRLAVGDCVTVERQSESARATRIVTRPCE